MSNEASCEVWFSLFKKKKKKKSQLCHAAKVSFYIVPPLEGCAELLSIPPSNSQTEVHQKKKVKEQPYSHCRNKSRAKSWEITIVVMSLVAHSVMRFLGKKNYSVYLFGCWATPRLYWYPRSEHQNQGSSNITSFIPLHRFLAKCLRVVLFHSMLCTRL